MTESFTTWCCEQGCGAVETGITAGQAAIFVATHAHGVLRCVPDELLLARMHAEADAILRGIIK